MPWVDSGYGSQASWHWTLANTYNMGGTPITVPACAITKLQVYTAGRGGSASIRLMLWNSAGTFLRSSDLFTVAQGSDKIGGQSWYEKNITPVVVSAGTVYVGHWRNIAYSSYYPTGASGILYRNSNAGASDNLSKVNNYGSRALVRLFYITAPTAPTGVGVSRSSDTSHTVRWTRNATTDRPYETLRVERWDNVSGAWGNRATLSGTPTSWIDTGTAANRYYRYRIRAENAAGNSAYAYSSYFYTTPAAPSNAAVSRHSDTQHNLSWTNGQYSANVCQYLRIQRWDNVGGAYVDLTRLSAPPPASFSDITTRADRRYRYRIRAENTSAAGATLSSDYVYTDYIYTTPIAPSTALAARDGQNVIATCTNNSTVVEVTRLEYRIDGGAWMPLTTLTGAGNYYLHVGAPGGLLRYRWRNERDSLYSAWVESNDILTEAPPAAPTNLSPNGVTFDIEDGCVFSWKHNTQDSSIQREAELRWREKGMTEWPGTLTHGSSAEQVSLGSTHFDNGKEYEWEVRTWGSHADPGPWSTTASFKTSARPIVVITYPAADYDPHDHPIITIGWEYTDPEMKPQIGYAITLFSAEGEALITHSGTGEVFEETLSYAVKDGTEYSVQIRVQDADGMWSTETRRIFSVAYSPPETPLVDLTLDADAGTVLITITNPPNPEAPFAEYNRVYRRIDNSLEVLIADHIPIDGSVPDFIPGVNNTNVYRVETVSEIGSVSESEETPIDLNIREYIWINAGPSFSERIKLSFQPSMDHDFGRVSVQRHFAGRSYPVSFEGEELNWESSISAAIDYEQIRPIEDIVQNVFGPYFYRDPAGRWFPVALLRPRINERPPGLPVFSCDLVRLGGVLNG